jgi:hypothetical protein
MSSLIDESIRLDTRARGVTIIRGSGNINTYMVSEITGNDRSKVDPYYDFESSAKLPSDCGIVSGDLIQCGDDYYLVMAIEEKWCCDELGFYKCTLYKCNSLVSVYYFNSATKEHDVLHKSNVRCLITQVRAQEWDNDKSLIIKQFRGRSSPFQVFAQSNSGIIPGKDCVLIDQADRRFRTNKDFDVFIADNISQTQVMLERY